MDGIKQSQPQESSYCVLQKNFLFATNDPGRMVPYVVIEAVQIFGKRLVVCLIGGNHFIYCRGAVGRMPTHVRAVRTPLRGTEIDGTLFESNEQSRQFSSRTRSRMRP